MRAMGVFLLMVVVVVFSWASRWYPDFDEGVKVAKEKNKLVLVYFYEDGCTYCQYMEDVVFIDPKVSTLMEKVYVVVPVNVDEIPNDLDRRFRAIGTPTFMIYDPRKDKIVMQIFGLQETDEFLDQLRSACRKTEVKRC